MSDQIGKEFNAEDMEEVRLLQSKYATNTAQIGQVEVELYILNKRLKDLTEYRENLFVSYDDLQKEEQELVQRLNEKYGDGVLDLDSGRFVPSNS